MTFTEAIRSGFQNYVGFSGRAIRSEYWFWHLFYFLVVIAAVIIDLALFRRSGSSPISTLAELALLLPSIAVAIRRLHDLDRTGWWFLLVFLPIIGGIWLFIWFCTWGTVGPNRFGPDALGILPVGVTPPATA